MSSKMAASTVSPLVKGLKSPTGGGTGSMVNPMQEPTSRTIHTAGLVVRDEKKPLTDDEIARLNIRKKLEREVIAMNDKSEINLRKECWYLMDCKWLNRWVEFTTSEDPETEPPGPVSTKGLLDEKNQPLPNLKAKIDYRGVSPLVYFLFLDLYGRDNSPDVCRYKIDIYMLPGPIEQLVDMQRLAKVLGTGILKHPVLCSLWL
jgi:hypothetical protein